MIIDAHVHCTGRENAPDVLRTFDAAKVDAAVLLAPFLSGDYRLADAASLRRANVHLSRLTGNARDRLFGFAVVNPLHDSAVVDLRHAVEDLGLVGLKMVPAGWHPYDEPALKVYEEAQRLGIPILFHSGIFIDGRSGRFCRPAFYEAVRDFPRLRVTLAHLGWPWCDEANAVGLIDLINGVRPDDSQFRFDISFGAPPIYRKEVLRKALAVLTPDLLQFGSDVFLPCSAESIIARMGEVSSLLDELEVPPAARQRIMAGTAGAWLKVKEERRE